MSNSNKAENKEEEARASSLIPEPSLEPELSPSFGPNFRRALGGFLGALSKFVDQPSSEAQLTTEEWVQEVRMVIEVSRQRLVEALVDDQAAERTPTPRGPPTPPTSLETTGAVDPQENPAKRRQRDTPRSDDDRREHTPTRPRSPSQDRDWE